MMDEDLDFTFSPSGIIYSARTIRIDPGVGNQFSIPGNPPSAPSGGCFMGSKNSMCVGVAPQGSENPPGLIGNTAPFVFAEPWNGAGYSYTPGGSGPVVAVYGPGRRCLMHVDPAFAGRIAPNDLLISSDMGYVTKASPFGPWNQWIIGIALSFANADQYVNAKVWIFPWSPTGS